MISFFSTLRLVAAILLTASVTPVQAAWAPHAFTVDVTMMYEFNPATGEVTFPESSILPGAEIAFDDELFGVFYYESAMAADFTVPAGTGTTSFYLPHNGSTGSFFSIARTGLSSIFAASPTTLNMIVVSDDQQIGWDTFSMDMFSEPGDAITQSVSFTFIDFEAAVFAGSSLPPELSLSAFWDHATFQSTWTRASDGMQLWVTGDISSLMYLPAPAPVPEPSGIFLFLVALMGAVLVARQRNA